MSVEKTAALRKGLNTPGPEVDLRRWMKIRQESLFLSVLEEFSGEFYPDITGGVRLTSPSFKTFPAHFTSASGNGSISERHDDCTEGHKTVVSNPQDSQGYISAFFESGNLPDAIGYDPAGGTSYGIYQLSSRKGTVDEFINYLERLRPDWAERLRRSGRADTGSTRGAFPREWKAIASESPDEFARIQHSFIREKFYEPLKKRIEEAFGWDVDGASEAVKEALWSTAVQHGVAGAFQLVGKVLSEGTVRGERDFLSKLYEVRSGCFGRLPDNIERAVIRRLEGEKEMLLALVEKEGAGVGGFRVTA